MNKAWITFYICASITTVLLDLVLNKDLLSYIRNFRMIIAGKSCPDRVTLKSRMAF